MNTNQHLFKYFAGTIILSIALLFTGWIINSSLHNILAFKYIIYIVSLFLVSSVLFHSIVVKATEKAALKFARYYLVSTIIKILIYLSFLIIFIIKLHEGIKFFLVTFLILYIIYTSWEVIILSKYLKNQRAK